jgi:transposase, IS5 family
MLGKSPSQDQPQIHLFKPILDSFIDLNHPLVKLGKKLNWKQLEHSFADLYSKTGTPSKPIRLMSGLLLLKQMFDHSDEVVVEVWRQNPYYQYFTGGICFEWEFPCDASDLVHFRKRIGEKGALEIFQLSVDLHQTKVAQAKEVLIDTTVEEKNITFPTDTKLAVKIIKKCQAMAEKENITLRQTYKRTVKQELIKCRFAHHPKRKKEGRKAMKRIKIIAGRLVRDLDRKATEAGKSFFITPKALFTKVLAQKKDDKDKIYSLHEPHVACIAKGKAHKPYEFGAKIGLATLPGSNIIVGIAHFLGNPHDSTTLEATLKSAEEFSNKTFKSAIVDRGYRGHVKIGNTEIVIPNPKKDEKLSLYQKNKKRNQCRSRAAIEPIISHVKHDYRMERNYLKGIIGDKINAILAVAAFNLKKSLKELIFWLQNLWTSYHKNISYYQNNYSCTKLIELKASC